MQLAKQQLETALRSAQRESMLITDSELAEVHYKLGRICWTMGGNELTDPTQARAHLEAATKEDSEIQVCFYILSSQVKPALFFSEFKHQLCIMLDVFILNRAHSSSRTAESLLPLASHVCMMHQQYFRSRALHRAAKLVRMTVCPWFTLITSVMASNKLHIVGIQLPDDMIP